MFEFHTIMEIVGIVVTHRLRYIHEFNWAWNSSYLTCCFSLFIFIIQRNHEHAVHLMLSEHRRPWTFATPDELPRRCRPFRMIWGIGKGWNWASCPLTHKRSAARCWIRIYIESVVLPDCWGYEPVVSYWLKLGFTIGKPVPCHLITVISIRRHPSEKQVHSTILSNSSFIERKSRDSSYLIIQWVTILFPHSHVLLTLPYKLRHTHVFAKHMAWHLRPHAFVWPRWERTVVHLSVFIRENDRIRALFAAGASAHIFKYMAYFPINVVTTRHGLSSVWGCDELCRTPTS